MDPAGYGLLLPKLSSNRINNWRSLSDSDAIIRSASANRLPGSDACGWAGLRLAAVGQLCMVSSSKLRLSAADFAAPESSTSHFPGKFA
jgi:hypothetical protein